jgi:hypothetical protein
VSYVYNFAVFLKNGKPERAVHCCKLVLGIDDNNVKGELGYELMQ